MNIKLLDSYVLDILIANGWYEDRKYNIAYWIDELEVEGYVSFDYAKEILESLGNLSFDFKDDGKHRGAQFDFNPYYAASGEFDRLEHFELLAKESLFPIGSMCAAIVYAGKSKNIYFGSMNSLYWSGNCIEDYLNRLFDKSTELPKLIK